MIERIRRANRDRRSMLPSPEHCAKQADRRRSVTRGTCLPVLVSSVVVVSATLTGCRGEDRLAVAPVRGQVIYQSRGVPNATVVFFPVGEVAEKVGQMRPFADTNGDGRFALKTYVGGDGAPPGNYRVSVIAPVGGDRRGRGGKDNRDDGAAAAPTPSIPVSIRIKYADVETAGIEVTVREGENNLEPFDLR